MSAGFAEPRTCHARSNDLAGRIDLESALRDAEALALIAGKAGEECFADLP